MSSGKMVAILSRPQCVKGIVKHMEQSDATNNPCLITNVWFGQQMLEYGWLITTHNNHKR